MNSSQFKHNKIKQLGALLGVSPKALKDILTNTHQYYWEKREHKLDASGRIKTYKDGTPKIRVIHPPNDFLKGIQKRIKRLLLDPIALPDYVFGSVKGKSNITNAKKHLGKKFRFETDLQNFFPSISNKAVYKIFEKVTCDFELARLLTILVSFKGELPQGAPTSSSLANIAFLPIDFEIEAMCSGCQITYTRYVDDLTFSSQNDFKDKLPEFLSAIQKGKFKISYRKTTYFGGSTITGIHVYNNHMDAPKKIKLKSAQELAEDSVAKPYTIYRNRIIKGLV